jgi:predicted nucleic acid-binding protein
MICVIDANVMLDILLNQRSGDDILQFISETYNVAPELIFLEVGNTLRKYVLRGDISQVDALSAFEEIPNLLSKTYPDIRHVNEAMDLSLQLGHSVYDCLYLVLARRMNGTLVSYDKKLAKLAKEMHLETFPLGPAQKKNGLE